MLRSKILLLFVLSSFLTFSFAQDYEIYQGSKTRIIKKTDLVALSYGKQTIEGNFTDENFIVQGYITSVKPDSITFLVQTVSMNNPNVEAEMKHIKKGLEHGIRTISKADISQMHHIKSVTKFKIRKVSRVVGSLLYVAGVVTGINALFLVDGDNTNWSTASLASIVTGGTLNLISKEKIYRFNKQRKAWNFR